MGDSENVCASLRVLCWMCCSGTFPHTIKGSELPKINLFSESGYICTYKYTHFMLCKCLNAHDHACCWPLSFYMIHVCVWNCVFTHFCIYVCVCVPLCAHTHTHTAAASVRFKIVLLIVQGHSEMCPPGYILLFSQFNKSDATPCSPRQLLHNSLTLCFSLPQIEWLNWCLLAIVLQSFILTGLGPQQHNCREVQFSVDIC